MTRRLVVAMLWLAALAGLATAIGLRVQSARLADPAHALRLWLRDVPAEVGVMARVLWHDRRSLQVELQADAGWLHAFAKRNGFQPVEGPLEGLGAERWVLTETKVKGGVMHLLRPLNGEPALISASAP